MLRKLINLESDMQQYTPYFEFIKNHWLLVLAFFIVLGLIIFEEMRKNIGSGKNILPQKAVDLINHGNAVVIDLRDQQAFISGHILESINVVSKDMTEAVKKIAAYKKQTVILLGKDEHSAASLQAKLQKEGFADVHVLRGGITAWKNASLPIIKK